QRPRELIALDRFEERMAQRGRSRRMGAHPVAAPAERGGSQRRPSARWTVDRLGRYEHWPPAEELACPPPGDARSGGPEPRRHEILRHPRFRQIARGSVDQLPRAFRGPQLRSFRLRGGSSLVLALV